MKILIATPSVGRGGVTRVVETLLPEIAKMEFETKIIGQKYNEVGEEIHYPESIPFSQIEPINKLPPHPYQFDFLINTAQLMADHIKKEAENFDLVWLMCPWWVMGSSPEWNIGKPTVINIPDFAFDHIDMGGYLTQYFRKASPILAKRAAATIFSSNFQKEWGENNYGFENTSLIRYCSAFVPKAEAQEFKLSLPKEYVLAFNPMGHKGIDTIVKAYGKLVRLRKCPPLVIAGRDTQTLVNSRGLHNKDHFAIRLSGLTLNSNLFILGMVDEDQVEHLYRNARLSIVASQSEGDLSGSIHESIRYKTPLVYSDIPVFGEQLINGVHGLSFPVNDAKKLSAAIMESLWNPKDALRRAERAYNDFNERSVSDVAREHLDVFKSVIAHQELEIAI